MAKQKKKAPGRPKKEFVSRKPKTKIKVWPWRPRKDKKDRIQYPVDNISPEIVSSVARSVEDSKKKDLIILILFLLSFILFIVSLYFTFMRDKKVDQLSQEDIAQITNIATWNIDYNMLDAEVKEWPTTPLNTPDTIKPTIQNLTTEQQLIVDFYQAVNDIDMTTLYHLTDARLEESNVFKTYYSRRWLSNFSNMLLAPKIVVSNIEEKVITDNPNIKNFTYTLEYTLANTQQKFTEERSTVLVKKGDNRRIGKLMCETKGCSTMPFFNPEKYK